jgi:cytochrome c peroxidase
MRILRNGVGPLLVAVVGCVALGQVPGAWGQGGSQIEGRDSADRRLDRRLAEVLAAAGFTGRIESKFREKLGRPIDRQRANLGRLLWFDLISGLNNDNTCAGCHSPTHGFGDTQPIAIGIDNNLIVGPHRTGPRNQRRTPLAVNTALYPTLMWNARFAALSGQAFIPPTERVEVAGFDFPGDNDDIRHAVLRRLNVSHEYRQLFGRVFPRVAAGAPITFEHFGQAIAEFEFTLVFANAPIDRFARGQRHALTESQKRGALLFFGKAGCVRCHSVAGESNEMFSDFRQHVIGVPQIVPALGNVVFDGPGANEDFGLEQVTGNPDDRYLFRTAPLRNAAVMPAFMHNGAFIHLEDAIRHHLDPYTSARQYTPRELPPDLQGPLGPIKPVLVRLDPLLQTPLQLTDEEFSQLVDFVRHGLLDPRILPGRLKPLVPKQVPSGKPTLDFEFE